MKTKLLIMATLAVACAFAFLGCDVNKNANGIKGFSVDKEKTSNLFQRQFAISSIKQ